MEVKAMETEVLDVKNLNDSYQNIVKGAEYLRKAGVVAIPTETVYGLAADTFNERVVKKYLKLKEDRKTILY
jgi:L-threonylcarbamoyladenylate synthase